MGGFGARGQTTDACIIGVLDAPRSEAVSAIVLNWQDAERTSRCVDSLLADGGLDEVILVDNQSQGLLRPLAAKHPEHVRLVESATNLGFSAGINAGISSRSISAAYLLIINNDAELLPGCLPALLEAVARSGPGTGLFAPVIVNENNTVQSAGEQFDPRNFSVRATGPGERIDFLTFACVLLPVATVEQVGLLDEGFFMYWEDVEYGLRCRRHGLELRIIPEATVKHELSASHAKASNWISLYSAMGLVVLARRLGGVAYAGMLWRLSLRLGKRLLNADLKSCRYILHGARLGLSNRQPLAHAAVDSVRTALR
jgi:GT2 family glycosyltransferase